MNAQRQEILLRIGQMHDLLKWKLLTCGGVFAFIFTDSARHLEVFYLLVIVPALLCTLIDSQYIQNGINIVTMGKFLREQNLSTEAYAGEREYERFIADSRRKYAALFIVEPALNFLCSLVITAFPTIWMRAQAIGGPGMQSVALLMTSVLMVVVAVPYAMYLHASAISRDPKDAPKPET